MKSIINSRPTAEMDEPGIRDVHTIRQEMDTRVQDQKRRQSRVNLDQGRYSIPNSGRSISEAERVRASNQRTHLTACSAQKALTAIGYPRR